MGQWSVAEAGASPISPSKPEVPRLRAQVQGKASTARQEGRREQSAAGSQSPSQGGASDRSGQLLQEAHLDDGSGYAEEEEGSHGSPRAKDRIRGSSDERHLQMVDEEEDGRGETREQREARAQFERQLQSFGSKRLKHFIREYNDVKAVIDK